jgi:hypothetical protein
MRCGLLLTPAFLAARCLTFVTAPDQRGIRGHPVISTERLSGAQELGLIAESLQVQENGRHEETRTPDLYRVNFEVTTLKTFPYLAFPHSLAFETLGNKLALMAN